MPQVVACAWAEVRAARGRRWLAAVGEFLPGSEDGYLEYQPCAAEVRLLAKAAQDALDSLAATPAARLRAARDAKPDPGPNMARLLEEAKALEAQARAEASDAEFTEGDEGDEDADEDLFSDGGEAEAEEGA